MTLYLHICPTCLIEFVRTSITSNCCSRRCARIFERNHGRNNWGPK